MDFNALFKQVANSCKTKEEFIDIMKDTADEFNWIKYSDEEIGEIWNTRDK